MAEEALEVGQDQNVRVGRVARQGQDRQLSDGVDSGGGKQQSPEEELAQTRRALEAKDADVSAANDRAARAEQEAAAAKRDASATTLGRLSDHEAALGSAIESAKSKKQAAATAYRSAREAGDMDAELAANELLAAATAELTQLSRDKQNFDAQKPRLEAAAKAPVQQQGGPTAEAQAWIKSNPRYNADRVYQSVAVGLHSQAIDDGIAEGSRAYIRYIDDGLKDLYGDDHGTLAAVGRRPGEQARQQEDTTVRDKGGRQASSEAARGDRGAGGNGLHVGNGAVSYTHRSGEKLSLSYNDKGEPQLQGRIPAEWMEGARICNMTPVAYAADQIKIKQELAEGGDAGLRFSDSVYA